MGSKESAPGMAWCSPCSRPWRGRGGQCGLISHPKIARDRHQRLIGHKAHLGVPFLCLGAIQAQCGGRPEALGVIMARYRTYLLDIRDQVDDVIEGDFEDDSDAVRATLVLRAGHAAAEVWRGDELVERVGMAFTPFAAPETARDSVAAWRGAR